MKTITSHTLVITTQSGKTYVVDINQNIIRTDMKHSPSGQWLFVGILPRQAQKLSRMITYHSLMSFMPSLLYKNGNPRYTIVDIDHGTTRTWSDGVANLQWID